jgi:hypothetical protein
MPTALEMFLEKFLRALNPTERRSEQVDSVNAKKDPFQKKSIKEIQWTAVVENLLKINKDPNIKISMAWMGSANPALEITCLEFLLNEYDRMDKMTKNKIKPETRALFAFNSGHEHGFLKYMNEVPEKAKILSMIHRQPTEKNIEMLKKLQPQLSAELQKQYIQHLCLDKNNMGTIPYASEEAFTAWLEGAYPDCKKGKSLGSFAKDSLIKPCMESQGKALLEAEKAVFWHLMENGEQAGSTALQVILKQQLGVTVPIGKIGKLLSDVNSEIKKMQEQPAESRADRFIMILPIWFKKIFNLKTAQEEALKKELGQILSDNYRRGARMTPAFNTARQPQLTSSQSVDNVADHPRVKPIGGEHHKGHKSK